MRLIGLMFSIQSPVFCEINVLFRNSPRFNSILHAYPRVGSRPTAAPAPSHPHHTDSTVTAATFVAHVHPRRVTVELSNWNVSTVERKCGMSTMWQCSDVDTVHDDTYGTGAPGM